MSPHNIGIRRVRLKIVVEKVSLIFHPLTDENGEESASKYVIPEGDSVNRIGRYREILEIL